MHYVYPLGYLGLNLYSRSEPHTPQYEINKRELLAAVDELGLSWVTKDFGRFLKGFHIVPHAAHCVYTKTPVLSLDSYEEWGLLKSGPKWQ